MPDTELSGVASIFRYSNVKVNMSSTLYIEACFLIFLQQMSLLRGNHIRSIKDLVIISRYKRSRNTARKLLKPTAYRLPVTEINSFNILIMYLENSEIAGTRDGLL